MFEVACGLIDGRFCVVLREDGRLINTVKADVTMQLRLPLKLREHVTQECCSNACDAVPVGDGQ